MYYVLSISITYVSSPYLTKIKVDSCDSLTSEKTMTFHDVMIFIKSVFNKDENDYYYNIFLEKVLYELPESNDNKYAFLYIQ